MPGDEVSTIPTSSQLIFEDYILLNSRSYYAHAVDQKAWPSTRIPIYSKRATWWNTYILSHYLGNLNNIAALFGTAQELYLNATEGYIIANLFHRGRSAHIVWHTHVLAYWD